MTRAETAAKIGGTILKIYACHILVFTAGACLAAFETFWILCGIWGPCK